MVNKERTKVKGRRAGAAQGVGRKASRQCFREEQVCCTTLPNHGHGKEERKFSKMSLQMCSPRGVEKKEHWQVGLPEKK